MGSGAIQGNGAGDRATAGMAGCGPDPGGERDRPLVLAVEDNPHDWEIYGKLLWYNGFDVSHAADGEEGLRLARQLRPDLILLDLMLPRLGGIAVCRALREDPEMARVPVIALTGRAWKDVAAEAEQAGFTCYLEKPVSPLHVFHEVERVLGTPPSPGEMPSGRRH